MLRSFGAAAAALALVATPVNASCWSTEDASAATIRQFQSMLMVAALRCQVVHYDMTGDYNGFLRANRQLLQQINDRIKAHFVKAEGPVGGQRAYDAFATTLANGYGAAESSDEVCGEMASLAREAGMMAGSEDGLLLLAARQGVATRVPDGSCGAPRPVVAMASINLPLGAAPAAPSPVAISVAQDADQPSDAAYAH